jgi:uncharacterized Zn finger protein
MTDLSRLSESTIQDWIGEPSFARGERYFQQGNILNPRRQGQTLKALCLGSQPQPYRVEILLDAQSIVAGECSCPVGGGGHCKHAAALLLTWLHEPEEFQETEDLDSALERRSKAELIALVRRMIQRYPDLELLLELPSVAAPDAGHPLDPELIRRQVNAAFARAGHDWGAASHAARDLQDVVDLGDEYALHGSWPNAATIYRTVAQEVLEYYRMVHDEGGDLNYIVYKCSQGLGRCLEGTEDMVQREGVLHALFDIYRWDVDSGGYGIGDEVPEIILAQTKAAERRRVSEWVRDALPQGDSWNDNYHRQAYGGLMLELLATELDDESFLQVCRETGRVHDLVNRLLALSRVDEAVSAAIRANDYELLGLADLFVFHGYTDRAERLIYERAKTSQDSRLTEWLKARAEESGDFAGALALAETLFWQRPSPQAYEEMGKLAQRLNRWDPLRIECLARLQDEGNYALLTEIHLLEGEVGRALETLEQYQRRLRWGRDTLSLKVAQAAERSRPRDAIQLYLTEVDRLIAARGRSNYAEAAIYLLRVRTLFEEMGDEETWRTLITQVREQNRRLPAMQDEFNQAGL